MSLWKKSPYVTHLSTPKLTSNPTIPSVILRGNQPTDLGIPHSEHSIDTCLDIRWPAGNIDLRLIEITRTR
jgi:hypothetical protein